MRKTFGILSHRTTFRGSLEQEPAGAKAQHQLRGLAARLKPRPDTNRSLAARLKPRPDTNRSLAARLKALRNIYGPSFHLVAAYCPREVRKRNLAQKLAASERMRTNPINPQNFFLHKPTFICYKQSTESRCVWQPVIVCISRVRPASK
jgi:hypothetical protein